MDETLRDLLLRCADRMREIGDGMLARTLQAIATEWESARSAAPFYLALRRTVGDARRAGEVPTAIDPGTCPIRMDREIRGIGRRTMMFDLADDAMALDIRPHDHPASAPRLLCRSGRKFPIDLEAPIDLDRPGWSPTGPRGAPVDEMVGSLLRAAAGRAEGAGDHLLAARLAWFLGLYRDE